MVVADDGRGFAPQAAASAAQGGFGLVGMRERVEKHGGRLQVASRPGMGTTVTCTIPIRKQDGARDPGEP
jgi:signal transduction histidine kinase